MDSTYRTNSSRFELFKVVTKIFGCEWPLAFMFFEGNRADVNGTKSRMEVLEMFVRSDCDGLSPNRHIFFFSDKDWGQLHAIRNMHEINPSICKCHLKKAIRTKIISMGRDKSLIIEPKRYMRLQNLIIEHCCFHLLFFVLHRSTHCKIARWTISILAYTVPSLIIYENIFIETGTMVYRSATNGISSTRTTMVVEDHWRLLERRYLVTHNRPRGYFVIYIISSRVMPKYNADYQLYITGAKKTYWWKQFKQKRKYLLTLPASASYNTSIQSLWCTCRYFWKYNLLLCKHLCQLIDLPSYREIHHSRFVPFYTFRLVECLPYALFEQTESNNTTCNRTQLAIPTRNITPQVNRVRQCTIPIWMARRACSRFNHFTIGKTSIWASEHGRTSLNYAVSPRCVEKFRISVVPRTWTSCPDILYLPWKAE